MVPSVVAMTDNGLIVGDPAKEHLTRNPERTVYSVKRFMGKGLADVQSELAYFPYSLDANKAASSGSSSAKNPIRRRRSPP